jgi:hypothetical protein
LYFQSQNREIFDDLLIGFYFLPNGQISEGARDFGDLGHDEISPQPLYQRASEASAR